MEAVVLYRMELKFVKNCRIGLAVEDEVHDVSLGRVGDTLEILCADGEKNVLHAVAIEIAGNESLFTEGLDDGLVANLADLAFKFEMLHF